MKDSEIIRNSSEEEQVETMQKQPYEKPQLGKVALFADNVLGYCSASISSGCDAVDPTNTI